MQSGWVIIVVLLEASLVLCFVILNLYDFQHPPKAIESNKSFLKEKKKKGREPKTKQKQGSSSVAYIRRGMLRGLDLYLWQQRASIFFLRSHF